MSSPDQGKWLEKLIVGGEDRLGEDEAELYQPSIPSAPEPLSPVTRWREWPLPSWQGDGPPEPHFCRLHQV